MFAHSAGKANLVLAIFILSLSMAGCASVIVKRVKGDSSSVDGIRFYRPVPYLMVSQGSSDSKKTSTNAGSDPSSTLQFSIVWMPDLSQEYVIRAKPGLGSVTFNPTLENGWNLTGLNASADSKTAEVLTAIAGFIPKAQATVARPGTPGAIQPGMYRFVFGTDPNDKEHYGKAIQVDFKNPVFSIPIQQ